jgi:hypothetical protein
VESWLEEEGIWSIIYVHQNKTESVVPIFKNAMWSTNNESMYNGTWLTQSAITPSVMHLTCTGSSFDIANTLSFFKIRHFGVIKTNFIHH